AETDRKRSGRPRRRGGPIHAGIDAELGDLRDCTPIPLGAQHAGCALGAGDGSGGSSKSVALHPRERRWIAANEVLPGEEQCRDPTASSLPHGEERRQVVRFFVDVHDVWSTLVEDPSELGEEK